MNPLVSLSLVWFLVLGGLGAFFPYYSLYLRESGLSGLQVGTIMAIPPLVGLVMQPFWGQVADRSGSRTGVLRVLAVWAAAGYLGLAFARGFSGLALGTLLFAMASVALLPSLVSVSLAVTRESSGVGLGRVRVWGTVGYGIVVVSFPFLAGRFATTALGGADAAPAHAAIPGLALMFPLAGALVLCGGMLAATLPRGGVLALRAERGDWRQLLRHGPFLRLLTFILAGYLFLQGPMALFPILVRAQGGGIEAISQMWILMLALEVPLVAWLGASVARLGLRGVIATGMAAGSLRWLVSGFADDLMIVTAVQLLHGVVVWGVILGAPMYADAVVPERLRSTGQGLLAMIGVSLGGFLSNLGSGWLIDQLGPTAPAQVGGIGGLILTALTPWWLPRPPPRPPDP